MAEKNAVDHAKSEYDHDVFVIHSEKGVHDVESNDAPSGDAGDDDPDFSWDFAVLSNAAALMTCYFASTWGLLVPSSSIPFLIEAFPQGAAQAAWVAAAASIPNCVVNAFMGEVSDLLGRKYFLLAGMSLGVAGSIVSSRATSITGVIGGQALNGCGLTLGYLAIPFVAEIVPNSKRPMMQAITGIMAGAAVLIGPIVQGAFIKYAVGGENQGWRAGFYLMAGFYAISFVGIAAFYHPRSRVKDQEGSVWSILLHMDWFGVLLVAAGLVLFLVGLQYGGTAYAWVSSVVLCTIIIGGLSMVGFGLWEWKGTKVGLFHHSLFEHRNFALTVLLSIMCGIVMFSGQTYLPQEITTLFTRDAIMTGVYNMPFNVGNILGGVISGILISILKDAKGVIVGSFVAFLVSSGLMAVMEPGISFAAWFFPTLLLGTAVGALLSALYVVVGLCTPNKLIATAMSLMASTRALGGSIGIVIFGQIYNSQIATKFPKQVSKALIEVGYPASDIPNFLQTVAAGDPSALSTLPGVSPTVLGAFSTSSAQAYADSFRIVWLCMIPFAAVSLILCYFLTSIKHLMTNQVAASVQKTKK